MSTLAKGGVTGTLHQSLPGYSLSYDLDNGVVLAVDVDGHGHDLETIETLLDLEDPTGELHEPTGWEITEEWRRTVPLRGEHLGDMAHHYQAGPGAGAKAVTHVALVVPTHHWCVNHRDRPSSVGIPAERVVDGAQILARESARADGEVDPRRTVDVRERPKVPSPYDTCTGWVYPCKECSTSFFARERAATELVGL